MGRLSGADSLPNYHIVVLKAPLLEQKFHKCLSGVFEQLPADWDITSVIKAKA